MSKILISDMIHEDGIALLKDKGQDVTESFDITAEQLIVDIPQYDALIVRGRTKVTKQVIEKGATLKIIARAGIGIDNIDVAAAKARTIVVVNAPGSIAEAVAEHTMAFMLGLARNLVPVATALKDGKWEKKTYTAVELHGKTLGIIGFGTIGSRVAALGAALGMKIVVYTRTHSPEKKEQLGLVGGTFLSLEELLAQSDVVSLHVPLSDQTKLLISAKELAMMKPTAYLINTARGGVVDERALATALKEKKLAGAALDVFSIEPLPVDSPLVHVSTVVLTPHIASVSPEGRRRASMMVCEDVDRVLKGEKPLHPVI